MKRVLAGFAVVALVRFSLQSATLVEGFEAGNFTASPVWTVPSGHGWSVASGVGQHGSFCVRKDQPSWDAPGGHDNFRLSTVAFSLWVFQGRAFFAMRPDSRTIRHIYRTHVIRIYTQGRKAAMIVAAFSPFWLVSGCMNTAHALCESLSIAQWRLLAENWRGGTLRLDVFVGLAMGACMLFKALAHGPDRSSWMSFVALAVLFLGKAGIMSRVGRRPISVLSGIDQVGMSLIVGGERERSHYHPAEARAVAASVAWPTAANLLGGLARTTNLA